MSDGICQSSSRTWGRLLAPLWALWAAGCGFPIGPDLTTPLDVAGGADVDVWEEQDARPDVAPDPDLTDAAVSEDADALAPDIAEVDAPVADSPDSDVAADVTTTDGTGDTFEVAGDDADAGDIGPDVAPPECVTAVDCDDTDACTADLCALPGTCTHTTLDCDDGLTCTVDTCASAEGCVHAPVDCTDTNACTVNLCAELASGCTWTELGCADNDACTDAACEPSSGCTQTTHDCDDGNACTIDACDNVSGCSALPVDPTSWCDDKNPCTDDTCAPALGCVNQLKPAGYCDDGVECTVDTCVMKQGCENLPNAALCADANLCNTDKCIVGLGCIHVDFAPGVTPTQCDDQDVCTVDSCEAVAGCSNVTVTEAACADGVFCTKDTCDPKLGCLHAEQYGAPCDDGQPCTEPDRCTGVTCTGYARRWDKTWDPATTQGQWVGQVRRDDASHLLLGWEVQLPNSSSNQYFPALQRIAVDGTPLGPVTHGGLGAGHVITNVSTVAGKTFVQGWRFMATGAENHPWYGWLGENDEIVDYATYESTAYGNPNNPMPAASVGLLVIPNGASEPEAVWFAVVTLSSDGSKHLLALKPGAPPKLLPLGSAGAGCTPEAVSDHLVVGSCNLNGTNYLFRAAFDDDGKVTGLVKGKTVNNAKVSLVGAVALPEGVVLLEGNATVGSVTGRATLRQFADGTLDMEQYEGDGTFGLALTEWHGGYYAVGALYDTWDKTHVTTITRVDPTSVLATMYWQKPGTWLSVSGDEDGLWALGGSGKNENLFVGGEFTAPHAARVDEWGFTSCAAAGKCASLTLQDCADGNSCSVDSCHPDHGCKSAGSQPGPCEDGEPCTLLEKCVDSACYGWFMDNCNDNNYCTDDSCVLGKGCQHLLHEDASVCYDGDSCSLSDICISGKCVGTAFEPVGTPCNIPGGVCSDNAICNIKWANEIAVGRDHTCAVRGDQGVYCWGHNQAGQLAHGTTDSGSTPAPVLASGTDAYVAADTHVAAGTLASFVWRDTPKTCSAAGTLTKAVTNLPGAWTVFDTEVSTFKASYDLTSVMKLALGDQHGCAWLADDTLRCWGDRGHGQTGIEVNNVSTYAAAVTLPGGVFQLAAGGDTTCFITTVNFLPYCFGANARLWATGDTVGLADTATPSAVPGLTQLEGIAVGKGHACALKNGGVWCWGQNQVGQVGKGTFSSGYVTPIPHTSPAINATALAAGDEFTCALLTDKTVRCWGAGTLGQLGDGNGSDSATSVAVPGLNNVTAISARGTRACALRIDGSVRCWGTGDGTSNLSPVALAVSVPAK